MQTIEELRSIARRSLPAFEWLYIEFGSEDELTLARNRTALLEVPFVPSTLVDTTSRDISITLFGSHFPSPIVFAPTGFNGIAYPSGDTALARASERASVPFTLSIFSTENIEDETAVQGGYNWCQFYVLDYARITARPIERARAADYKALIVATDANAGSSREWQKRCYRSPGTLMLRHLIEAGIHLRWIPEYLRAAASRGGPVFAKLAEFFPSPQLSASKAASLTTSQRKPGITWTSIARIRKLWDRPLIIKGVLSRHNTLRAREAGADGSVIINNGGRQLDGTVSSMDMRAAIRTRLPDFPILVVSGFRRGADVVKAIGYGARRFWLAGPLYALAAAGEARAFHALTILFSEIHRCMKLLGSNALSDTSRHIYRSADHRHRTQVLNTSVDQGFVSKSASKPF